MYVFTKWAVGILLLCGADIALAQNVHGVLRVVKGDVQIKSARSGQTARARLGEQVYPKDIIITGKDARAKVVMVDKNELNISPESSVEIQHYDYDPAQGKKDVLLNVIYGKVRAKVEQKYDGKTTKFQVKTPAAVAGVRGTDFITSFDRQTNNSQVITFHGKVEFGKPGPGGTISNPVAVTPGKMATSMNGAAPGAPTSVPKAELNKMDNESKAEAPAAKGDSASGKGDAAGEKSDEKKDEGKKAEAKEEGKKADTSAKDDSGKKSDSGGGKDGGTAAGGTGPGSGDRGPASEQSGSVPMIQPGDTPGSGPTPLPPGLPPPSIPPNLPVNNLIPPPRTDITGIIQNGNSKVNITIKRQ